jgi:DNA mismatch repair protein MutH
MNYNASDKASIIQYARQLKGKSLKEACNQEIIEHNYNGKGNFGQVLEKFYFGYEPNNESEPDFAIAGIELKSSPLKQLKNLEYRAKERLVLNIINYIDLINQDFETSSFYRKNACLLLVFYLHDSNLDILDYIIKLVDEWSFTETDIEVIKKDWELIRDKVRAGKAHELSEGDTFYLGACTKGQNANSTRPQPNNHVLAMQRAFSFKQSYVNHIIASIANESIGIYGKLIPSAEKAQAQTIEEIVIEKFSPYLGNTINQIIDRTNISLNPSAKSFYANLTNAILGIELDKKIEEFDKAEIIIRTVRLKENNLPCEDISFPTFKFAKIINEEWIDSDFKDVLDHKFLFIFYQYTDKELILKKAKFWNMPFIDIFEAEKVWNETKRIVQSGSIINKVISNRRFTNFPNKSFNPVAHVRPHAKNALDTYTSPVMDELTGAPSILNNVFGLIAHMCVTKYI